MSSRVSAALLIESAKKLQAEWEHVRSVWTDAKSLEFEKHYLDELPGLIAQAGAAVDEINLLLAKVRRDCE
ncbi:MAG: hypothetical protein ACOYMN_09970 [Roseimicrobium sp.]